MGAIAEFGRQDADALERIGRVERNLDQSKARLVERAADGRDLVGLDAAENRNQRQGGEMRFGLAAGSHGLGIREAEGLSKDEDRQLYLAPATLYQTFLVDCAFNGAGPFHSLCSRCRAGLCCFGEVL